MSSNSQDCLVCFGLRVTLQLSQPDLGSRSIWGVPPLPQSIGRSAVSLGGGKVGSDGICADRFGLAVEDESEGSL